MSRVILAVLLALYSSAMLAQKADTQSFPNPVVRTVQQIETRQSKNLIGAADEMPADKYSYHPTPQQMTFAHLIMHIAQSNGFLCARIAGEAPREMKVSETDSKELLTKALKDSFAYCEQVLAKADDSNLGEPVHLHGDRVAPRAAALVSLAADWADHYSMAAIYLRLNNLLPPSANQAAAPKK